MKCPRQATQNPAFQELGVKQGSKVHLVRAPPGHRKLLAPLPEGVEFVPRLSERTDLVHFFSTRKAQLKKALPAIRKKMKADGGGVGVLAKEGRTRRD